MWLNKSILINVIEHINYMIILVDPEDNQQSSIFLPEKSHQETKNKQHLLTHTRLYMNKTMAKII